MSRLLQCGMFFGRRLMYLAVFGVFIAALSTCKKNDVSSVQNNEVKLQQIKLNRDTINVLLGSKAAIGYSLYPANTTDSVLTFSSSSPSVATVEGRGLVTGVKLGTAKITISHVVSGISAICVVNVVQAKATSLTLNKTTVTMAPGQIDTLVATLGPPNVAAEQLIWSSSNTGIATVDPAGLVVAQNTGNATISAKTADGRLTAQCSVTVNTSQSYLKLNETNVILAIGNAFTLHGTVTPPNGAQPTLVYSSNNTSVATVEGTDFVTARGVGNAVITVKTADGKLTAGCAITVVPTPVSSIKLNQANLTLAVGSSYTLLASVVPSNAIPQQFVWSSTTPAVAAVNANGVVSANISGNTTIKVSTADGKFSATCLVAVAPNNVTGIKVDSTQFMLLNGTSLKMGYTLSPQGVTNTGISWSSDNTAVATVGADGTINGLTAGKANITAKTNQGAYTSMCTVSVVTISSFLDSYLYSTTSTINGRLVEKDSIASVNYSLYDAQVYEIDVLNNENTVIGALKTSSGAALYTLRHAAGGFTPSPSQSFVISQVEPGATTRQNWPVVVYFTCNGVNYKMTLTPNSYGYAHQVVVQQ